MFTNEEIDSLSIHELNLTFGNKKKLVPTYKQQTLLALSYFPELTDTKIIFKSKRINSPLMMRPSLASSIFRSAKKRTYIIFISSYSSQMDPVIMDKLSLNAQVGRWGIVKLVLGNLSSRYIDRLEFNNDKATIEHGLGWQLLSWSEFVREKLKMERWRGVDGFLYGETDQPKSRYMNPETIRAAMKQLPVYEE
jgi:hypothetical protein